MTNLEKICDALKCYEIMTILSKEEIVQTVQKVYGVETGSIIPSDYCYNRVNEDKLHNRKLLEFNIFEYIDRNTYRYLGENYPYSGSIYHKKHGGMEQIVGTWENGIRIL